MDFRTFFINYYYNHLLAKDVFGVYVRDTTGLFQKLQHTVENSPWHREQNVFVHTNMVVAQYLSLTNSVWTKDDLLGALALVFHDVGKPMALTEKFSESRGKYFSFHGHEQIGARKWEDFAARNWKDFSDVLSPDDIYRISWLIEYHLPWEIKKTEKREMLTKTVGFMFNDPTVFSRVLWADQLGRLSDDSEKKLAEVGDWINQFEDDLKETLIRGKDKPGDHNKPICWIPIAPSGAGKSTFRSNLYIPETMEVHSLDDLRLKFYGNDYSEAYLKSVNDSDFSNKVQKDFIEKVKTGKTLYIDNTNLSRKRRRFYITEARKRGYWIIAVLFPVSLKTVVSRQFTRQDKNVPDDAVYSQYYALQAPSLGEVDEIRTVPSNLKV